MKAQLTHQAWAKMRAFVDNCEDEISGLGKVEIVDGAFLVTDIAIFEQAVGPAHSNIPAQALAKFQCELLKKKENPKEWFLWWHSHAKMSTFFSGTDMATIESSTDFPMMLSIVTNHKHEFSARFDLYKPMRMDQKVTVEVLEDEDEAIIAHCKAEIAKKVTKPVKQVFGYGWGGSKQPVETTAIESKEDKKAYFVELNKLRSELKEAEKAKDVEYIEELKEAIYDKRIDGFYSGYESQYPVKPYDGF